MVKFWTSRRLGRGDFFFSVLALNLAYLALQFWLTGAIDLMLQLGFRSEIASLAYLPAPISLLRLAFDAALLWCIVRRLRDAALPGWIVLAAVALALVPNGIAALLVLIGVVALFFIPGTVGPNRFGPDPRGWKSREQFDEQQQRLRSGDV